MQEPLVRIVRQDACERGGRRDAGRAERDVGRLRRRREAGFDAEPVGDEAEEMLALRLAEAGVLVTPAVELEPFAHA